MQNDYLDTQILFHQDDHVFFPGANISGQIIFTPKIDLKIQEIGYQVVMIVKGHIIPSSKTYTQQIFLRNKTLKKGQNYNYNFRFIVPEQSTYDGKNIDITWEIESIANLQTDSYLKVRNDYLKRNNLLRHHDTNTLLWNKSVFEILESDQPYTVELKNETIENSPILAGVFFAGGTFAIAWLSAFFELNNQFEIVSATAGILFITFLVPYLYKNNILNSINVNTKPLGDNQFIVLLDLARNFKRIQKVSVNYEVFEEVKDRSKDNIVVHKSKIYDSSSIEKHKVTMATDKSDILDYPEISYDFIFDLPTENIPTSITLYDLKLYWKINITVYFLGGFTSTFVKNIDVKRENKK